MADPSTAEITILSLLRSSGWMYGLELVKASNGALRRGTVYVLLLQMEEKGWIVSKFESAPKPPVAARFRYSIAKPGSTVLDDTTEVTRAFDDWNLGPG